jgi:hypothetical protein
MRSRKQWSVRFFSYDATLVSQKYPAYLPNSNGQAQLCFLSCATVIPTCADKQTGRLYRWSYSADTPVIRTITSGSLKIVYNGSAPFNCLRNAVLIAPLLSR